MKRQGILVGKFEFNSYARLMWTLPELHFSPKTEQVSITSYSSREDPVGTCRDCRLDSHKREISRNQAWKQKLNKSISFNYYFFECTLHNTSTAKNGDQFRRQHRKWDQNPWFVPETMSILSTFAYRSSPPGFWTSAVKAVSRSVAPCQVSYSLNSDLGTQISCNVM